MKESRKKHSSKPPELLEHYTHSQKYCFSEIVVCCTIPKPSESPVKPKDIQKDLKKKTKKHTHIESLGYIY